MAPKAKAKVKAKAKAAAAKAAAAALQVPNLPLGDEDDPHKVTKLNATLHSEAFANLALILACPTFDDTRDQDALQITADGESGSMAPIVYGHLPAPTSCCMCCCVCCCVLSVLLCVWWLYVLFVSVVLCLCCSSFVVCVLFILC